LHQNKNNVEYFLNGKEAREFIYKAKRDVIIETEMALNFLFLKKI
jgi:hypothetical protein